jgi:hypothetical protein
MKRDRIATDAAKFEDPKSFIFKDGREFLAGLDWKARKHELWTRARGRCEYINSDGIRCRTEAADPHHYIPRSKGRDDRMSNLFALCRFHHNLMDTRKVRSDRKEHRDASA